MKSSQAPKSSGGQLASLGEPLDPENPKRNAILMAAAQLFLERGYEPVSVDMVAAQADVSKRTIYSYFESKSELFSAILVAHCQGMGGIALPDHSQGHDPKNVLTEYGRVFLRMITSPRAVAMQRVIFREVDRLPEIGEIFFRSGPERHIVKLSQYLKQASLEKLLTVKDPEYSALFFMSTVKAPFHLQQLCGLIHEVEASQIEKSVKSAVDVFLRAHSVR